MGVAEDKNIIAAAQKLLALMQSQKGSTTYDVKIQGNVQGFVQGHNATVTMNFDRPLARQKKKK